MKPSKLELGIATLANEPIALPGFLGHRPTFSFPVQYVTAKDAWANRVLDGEPALAKSYAEAAAALEANEVAAVLANCGFAIVYQDAMAEATSIPVATSSLLFAPLALRMIGPNRTLGILTADGSKLRRDHLLGAGLREADLPRVFIAGIEGSPSAEEMLRPVPRIDLQQLQHDVLFAARRVASNSDRLGALLFECTGFGPAVDLVRSELRVPIFDVLLLARFVMDACGADTSGGSVR